MTRKVVRVSAIFDFYPDEDDLMTEMSDETLKEYAVDCIVEDFDRFVKYNEVRDALAVEIIDEDEQPNISLTAEEFEALTGFFGEMLDDNDLDENTRRVAESIYKKAAIQLGVW